MAGRLGIIGALWLASASRAAHAGHAGGGEVAGSLLLLVAPYLVFAVVAALIVSAYRRGPA